MNNKMSDKVKFVDYQEPLSIKVEKFLLSKGFDLASSTGIALKSLVATASLGVLRKDVRLRKYLFGLITIEPRRMFLGVVWFNNSARDANEQSWVFEAYGREHIELVKQLAEEMALAFNVKIALRLMREQSDVETYLSDD